MEERCMIKTTARGGGNSTHILKWKDVIQKYATRLSQEDAFNLIDGNNVTITFPSNSIIKSIEFIMLA